MVKTQRSGAEILIESLKNEGVEVIFGYPGGVLLGLYDVIFDAKILHILPRHEQGGIHAADGYARSTGKVGVCIGTSGPGATNLVTGIATAYMDSSPLVVLTGQVPNELIGGDAFQEADITGITRPIVKHSYLVKDVKDLEQSVREAFHIAKTGRPGPVVIDLPKDVMATKTSFKLKRKLYIPGYNPNYEANIMQVKKLLKALESAKRPLLYIGGGVKISNATNEVIKLSEMLDIPVVSSFMGLGGMPGTHKNYLGFMGMHGSFAANMAITECDYLIAVGSRFSDRSTGRISGFAPNTKIAHIDIDPSSISKNIPIDIPIVADAKIALQKILDYIDRYDFEKNKSHRKNWLEKTRQWVIQKPFTYKHSNSVIKPQYVIEKIYELTGGKAIITTEVGQNQMWAGQFYKFSEPKQFISSGGLGTMGFGFPAAIGAKIGNPNRFVFDIAGDGSFLMNMQELCTAKQYRVGVKIAILNNQFLGMVKQWQHLFYNKRYSYSCLGCQPDFVKLADAFNCKGFTTDKVSDVEPIIKESLKIEDMPVIMDFRVDRNENVYPMVPAGAALNEMILEE
ncbi:MAG: biosynthetic-type acetolactate synthase large subunit [Deferribacterota bacterium]|nr:biosynthetic-type acetolactate synthase large subunit [Deferribacterota bacterium]